PGGAAVVGAKSARSRDSNPHALGIGGIEDNGMKAHAAGAGLPLWAGAVTAQAGHFLPVLAAVRRAKNGGIFHAGIHGVRVMQRRFPVSHPFVLLGLLRAVVELMCGQRFAGLGRSVIDKLVAGSLGRSWGRLLSRGRSWLLPGFAAIIGALDDLAEPT